MKSKFLLGFFLSITFFSSGIFTKTYASSLSNSLPSLYLSNIKLDKSSYKLGDTINGTFDIQNNDKNVTPDIDYLVSLVGLDSKGNVARVVYNTEKSGPLNIAANSTKTVSFSYKLTSAPPNEKLGIHVRAIMESGTSLSWFLVPIKISGGLPVIDISTAGLTVNDKMYGLQVGPTITSKDQVQFFATYLNFTKSSLSLTPNISLLDKASQPIVGIPTSTSSQVTFSKNATTTVKLDLPVQNLKPGVYLAEVSLLDKDGNVRAPDLFVRYIVGGDIVNVQSVYSDKNTPVSKGDELNLAIGYTGDPLDITKLQGVSSSTLSVMGTSTKNKIASPIPSTNVTADIDVKLFNQDNKLVGQSTLKDQTFLITGFLNVPVKLNDNASSLKAEVRVYKGDVTLADYTGVVSFDATKIFTNLAKGNPKPNYTWFVVIGIVVLVIVIIFLLLFFKKIRFTKTTALVLLILISGVSFLYRVRGPTFFMELNLLLQGAPQSMLM